MKLDRWPVRPGFVTPPGGMAGPGTPPVAEAPERPRNEPSIAVDPSDSSIILVTANDYQTGDSRIGLFRSQAGGSFTSQLLPQSSGLSVGSDGVVDTGLGGLTMVAGLLFNRTLTGIADGTIVSYSSTDHGVTFNGPVIINQGSGTQVFNDKPYLAIDKSGGSPFRGRAYVSYTPFFNNFASTVIAFQSSADGGTTWSTPVILSPVRPFVWGSSVALGPLGEIYVSWIDADITAGTGTLFIRRSNDGGASFDGAVAVSDVVLVPSLLPVTGWAFRVKTSSFVAADRSSQSTQGNVYTVWQDNRGGNANILLSVSSDGGATWSPPVQINDVVNAQNFFPYVAVSPDTGAIKSIFYSNRITPGLIDVFTTTSMDGGATFSPDVRVTSQSFNPNADTFFGNPCPFIGDYIWAAIQSPQDTLLAAWTDTRTGSQEIFLGAV